MKIGKGLSLFPAALFGSRIKGYDYIVAQRMGDRKGEVDTALFFVAE